MQLSLEVNRKPRRRVYLRSGWRARYYLAFRAPGERVGALDIRVLANVGRRLPRTRRMRIVDLSRPIHEGMPGYPGDPEVGIEILGNTESASGLVRRISLGSHTGTHVDAFSHMHKDGHDLDHIPLERFLGPAQAVRPHQTLPPGVGLIFLEAPAMQDDARIAAAVPPFVAGELPAELERSLLARQILTYTNLVNLDQLPEGIEFTFYGLPLPIEGGDGSPVRAVAIIP